MGLEAVTGAMTGYADKVKAPSGTNTNTGKSMDIAGSQTAGAAVAAGLKNVNIVPLAENSGNKDGNGQESKQQTQAREQAIKSAVKQANHQLKMERTKCAFSYDEETKRVSIKVYNAETEEIIREIPPEESLEMVEKMWELAGLIVDEKR